MHNLYPPMHMLGTQGYLVTYPMRALYPPMHMLGTQGYLAMGGYRAHMGYAWGGIGHAGYTGLPSDIVHA